MVASTALHPVQPGYPPSLFRRIGGGLLQWLEIQEETPMPRRLFPFAVLFLLAAVSLWAEIPGERELALGREALAQRDYSTAAEHLTAATAALDPQSQRELLAEAWLQLGMADLAGLDQPEEALAAFRKSAELAANPASAWLWASTAAEKLRRAEEAAEYKARALAPPAPPKPTPEAKPEPAPAAAPQAPAPAKPDAFQHFFGPKEPAAAQPAPPPQAAPAEPVKKGDAFQHMFGEASPERPAGTRAAQEKDKDSKDRKDIKGGKDKDEKARAAKGDAFRHFFGEKKVEKKPEEESAPPPR
jgi:tetratricopeptide (TPR) repeat protein